MTSLTPAQLGAWVFNMLETRASLPAEKQQRLDRIRFVMEQGVEPDWTNDQLNDGVTRSHKGYSLAMAAAYATDADAIALLAEFKVNMNLKDTHDMTALLYVIRETETPYAAACIEAAVDALIEAGADVNAESPLIKAVGSNQNGVLKKLIAAGADVDAINSWGENALVAAVAKQNLEAVKILLAANADPLWTSKKTGKNLSDFANLRAKDGPDGVEIAQLIDDAIARRKTGAKPAPDRKPDNGLAP